MGPSLGQHLVVVAEVGASVVAAGHPARLRQRGVEIERGLVVGRVQAPLEGDFPRLIDGARGVRFIEKAVESAHSTAKWTAY